MFYTLIDTLCHPIRVRVKRVFSHDVMAAILVSQTNPLGVELFSLYANAIFCSKKVCIDAGHVSENTLYLNNIININKTFLVSDALYARAIQFSRQQKNK